MEKITDEDLIKSLWDNLTKIRQTSVFNDTILIQNILEERKYEKIHKMIILKCPELSISEWIYYSPPVWVKIYSWVQKAISDLLFHWWIYEFEIKEVSALWKVIHLNDKSDKRLLEEVMIARDWIKLLMIEIIIKDKSKRKKATKIIQSSWFIDCIIREDVFIWRAWWLLVHLQLK